MDEKEIIREVLREVDLNRFPFDEFWFDIGFKKAMEEVKKAIDETLLKMANILHPSNQDFDWYKEIRNALLNRLGLDKEKE